MRLELQADCLAGIWGAHRRSSEDVLEPGDLEEGLDAAAAVGDDRLQEQSGRGVDSDVVDARLVRSSGCKWFRERLRRPAIRARCDTFAGDV